jgi:hypothetical protein
MSLPRVNGGAGLGWLRDLKLSLGQVIFFAQHVSIVRALHLIARNLGTTEWQPRPDL